MKFHRSFTVSVCVCVSVRLFDFFFFGVGGTNMNAAIACQRVSRDLSKRAGEIFQIALDVVVVVRVVVVVTVIVVVVVAVAGEYENVLQFSKLSDSALQWGPKIIITIR